MLVLSVAEVVSFFFLQIFKMILLRRFTFFPVLLRMTSCCCLVHHLSADDETSDVLKRPRKIYPHVLVLCFLLKMIFITGKIFCLSFFTTVR